MKKLFIKLIRLYQKYISPMKRTKCPYIPTCSQYGLEAIEKYGAFKGGLLAVWRSRTISLNGAEAVRLDGILHKTIQEELENWKV